MKNQHKITEKYFHHILRRYRLAAGLTQDELAARAFMSKSFYSMMELGRRCPNLNRLLLIARGLGVEPGIMVNELAKEAEKDQKSLPEDSWEA